MAPLLDQKERRRSAFMLTTNDHREGGESIKFPWEFEYRGTSIRHEANGQVGVTLVLISTGEVIYHIQCTSFTLR